MSTFRRYSGILIIISSLAVTSCDDFTEDDRDVSGIWHGTALLEEDGCLLGLGDEFSFTHSISQDDDDVSVIDNAGILYAGDLDDDNNGFSVESVDPPDATIGDNDDCTLVGKIDYSSVDEDDDENSEVTIEMDGQCGEDFSCRTIYQGEAVRNQ